MKTELAFEIMEKINPDVAEIFGDPEVMEVKKKLTAGKDGAEAFDAFSAVELLVPLMCGKHKNAVINIVAAVSEKTPEEVAAQEFSETRKVWAGGFVSELFAFFAPTLRMVLRA